MNYYDHSQSPIEFAHNNNGKNMRTINWNDIRGDKDLEVWNRVTQNFWLPERILVPSDTSSWNQLSDDWRQFITHTFAGLTLLNTAQSSVDDIAQIRSSRIDIEQVIYANFAFTVAVHTRSYGTIFSTLYASEQIEEAHEWVVDSDALQTRVKAVIPCYTGNDPLKSKVATAIMSRFLLYSGFYPPFYLTTGGKLPNTADIARLILRDKVIHNYYGGYEYQSTVKELAPARQAGVKKFVFNFLDELIDSERRYLHELYDDFDLVDDTVHFSLYSTGKFSRNLSYDFPSTVEETYIFPGVSAQLSAQTDENRDFFFGNGSSYVMGTGEETKDDNWDF